eukprot:m51a1_g413 hypothetical protein (144) ;mRNA; f:769228-769754
MSTLALIYAEAETEADLRFALDTARWVQLFEAGGVDPHSIFIFALVVRKYEAALGLSQQALDTCRLRCRKGSSQQALEFLRDPNTMAGIGAVTVVFLHRSGRAGITSGEGPSDEQLAQAVTAIAVPTLVVSGSSTLSLALAES